MNAVSTGTIDSRLLVALDECVLLEAVLHWGSDHPCARIMEVAALKIFRLLLVERVLVGARAKLRLQAPPLDEHLDRLLNACDVTECPEATETDLARYKRQLWAALRHEDDAEVGVAIRCFPERAHVVVSTNRRHWRPTEATKLALGGTEVMRAHTFWNLLNSRGS